MHYRAHVRLDLHRQKSAAYQKLVAAFQQAGWRYVQTSALAIETDDLRKVILGLELLAKQIQSAGTLTGLSFDVQGSTNFNGIPYAATKNHPHALADIRGKRLP